MRLRTRDVLCLLATKMLLAGCTTGQLAWTGNVARGTVDSLLGFPAMTVVAGASDVLDAGNETAHERRVEELSSAYSEFLVERRQDGADRNRRGSPVRSRPHSTPAAMTDAWRVLSFPVD